MKAIFAAALLLCSVGLVRAESLVCEGVLGNSGEVGESLVRFAPAEAGGLGVVVDRLGSLWDRGGQETLNRYAVDGRLTGQYKLPKTNSLDDHITLARDLLVLKVGDGLYSLPIDAPYGTPVKNLNVKATRLAFNGQGAWVAASADADIFLLNPATGEKKPVVTLPAVPGAIEYGPDGALYTATRGEVSKVGDAGGDWPKKFPGDRFQWLDGAWWGHSYHGTIYRYDDTWTPAPGVVLGGGSGSFIGHLDQNTELNNGRGLALVRPGLYAVSGWSGTMHLLQWQEDARQFEIVRRIGAVVSARGLGLDRAGNVWWRSGSWSWTDGPDAPLRHGINIPPGKGISQAVMLPTTDSMVAFARSGNKLFVYQGRLTGELDTDMPDVELPRELVAATSYLEPKKGRYILAVNDLGQGRRFSIGSNDRFRADLGPSVLQTATPVKLWTSLATKDDNTLIGAADGNIIELARDGDNWKETARWNSWGTAETFGDRIWIAADAGRLWVSDRSNNRVLCLDLATKKLIASFGAAKGDDLTHLDAPETVAARANRAVVFDSANQRLLKLTLQNP